MLFLPVLIIAIVLYIIGKRVLSVLIFFFFLFEGYQVVPDILFNTYIGISKSADFAFIYIFTLFVYGIFKYDNFIPINRATKLIAFYLSFIVISVFVSLFYYHISIFEVIRTIRPYFLVLSYFVLRRLDEKDVGEILKFLLIIVIIQCLLFSIQSFTGMPVLAGANSGDTIGIITRFYNSPIMLSYIVFYAIFKNPFDGWIMWIVNTILVITIFLPMHRSLIMTFILVLFLGFCLNNNGIKRLIKYVPLLILFLLPVSFIALKTIGIEKTVNDISTVMNGDFLDLDEDFVLDGDSTLMFRMLHLFERLVDVTDTKVGIFFGAGFMSEDSEYTSKRFDYQIGLTNEETGKTVQIESSDIAWSNFIIRYGVIGTLVYLILYFGLCIFFYRNKKNKNALACFLYMLLAFMLSLTSAQIYYMSVLVVPLLMFDKSHDSDLFINDDEMES